MRTLIRHIRSNAVAYLALFFALGGGGGYAIAATTGTSRTVHTCVVKKTGELLAKRRCTSAEKPVSLNSGTVTVAKAATPGLGAVSAYVNIGIGGGTDGSKNATAVPDGNPGEYKISVPASVCPISGHQPSIALTAVGGGEVATANSSANIAVGSVIGNPNPQNIVVQLGLMQGGSYVAGGQVGGYVQIDC